MTEQFACPRRHSEHRVCDALAGTTRVGDTLECGLCRQVYLKEQLAVYCHPRCGNLAMPYHGYVGKVFAKHWREQLNERLFVELSVRPPSLIHQVRLSASFPCTPLKPGEFTQQLLIRYPTGCVKGSEIFRVGIVEKLLLEELARVLSPRRAPCEQNANKKHKLEPLSYPDTDEDKSMSTEL
eukprot:scaffold95_cov476-Prasinococcus_capsulatus_cf.AAC.2